MDNDKYNGYTNYATWNICLWIDNDEADQEYWKDVANGKDRHELASVLEDYFKDNIPDEVMGPHRDILLNALGNVDWVEVADNILSE